MAVMTFRFGQAPPAPVAIRILATRFLPRGVAKVEWPRFFDVWFPPLAPSAELLRWYRGQQRSDWKRFTQRYAAELKRGDGKHLLALLHVISRQLPIAVGCYCQDESTCHRTLLARWVEQGRVL